MYDLGYIAGRLKKARINLGLTQEAAAKKCRVSPRTLKNYERYGIRDILTLDKICTCYGISLDITIGEVE
ncbi:MAG: helix-turn-helix transcriptional regulator [Candidatus Thiodiazotropha endolucinida]